MNDKARVWRGLCHVLQISGVDDGARTHDNRNHNRGKRESQRNQEQTKAIKSIYYVLWVASHFSCFLPPSVPPVSLTLGSLSR